MSRAQKVKQFVYGLGAMGGGLALLMTCADRYYNGDPSNNQKRALYNKIRSQLCTYYPPRQMDGGSGFVRKDLSILHPELTNPILKLPYVYVDR